MREEYDAAVNTALQGVAASWSDMEKLLYLNDYLARNCEYDTALLCDGTSEASSGTYMAYASATEDSYWSSTAYFLCRKRKYKRHYFL